MSANNDSAIPSLDWRERMTILDRDYNFVPTTKEELNVAFGSIPFINEPGGVGRHLNEILLHQNKHGVDSPDRAVRAVVRDMGYYRVDAIERRSGLLAVYHVLEDANPTLEVGLIADLDIRGLLSSVQYAHISKAKTTGDDTSLQGGIKVLHGRKRLVTAYDIETHDKVSTDMLVEQLEEKTVLDMRGLVVAAGKSHRGRRDFWSSMLENSRTHAAARPIVNELLAA